MFSILAIILLFLAGRTLARAFKRDYSEPFAMITIALVAAMLLGPEAYATSLLYLAFLACGLCLGSTGKTSS